MLLILESLGFDFVVIILIENKLISIVEEFLKVIFESSIVKEFEEEVSGNSNDDFSI